jgi:hypothetical protein
MALVEKAADDDPNQALEAPKKPSLLSRLTVPVFFDFVWGDTASPLVSHAVVLRMIKCVLVILTQATDYLKKSQKKKGKVAGAKAAANALKDKVRRGGARALSVGGERGLHPGRVRVRAS